MISAYYFITIFYIVISDIFDVCTSYLIGWYEITHDLHISHLLADLTDSFHSLKGK